MSKSIFTSKVFWGAILTAVLVIDPNLFVQIGLTGDSAMYADKIAALVTTVFTIWARFQTGGVHILPPTQ